jgi:hypothetical protein
LFDQKNTHINKLVGFTLFDWFSIWFILKNWFKGNFIFFPHINSYRVGWKIDKSGNVGLYHYYYVNGVRSIEYMGSVLRNKEFDVRITISETDILTQYENLNIVKIAIGNERVMVKFPNVLKAKKILLDFYYGGKPRASNDLTLHYQKIQ